MRFDRIEKLLSALGCPLQTGDTVLDFGCGDGRLVEDLCSRGYDAYGCDIVLDEPTARLRRIEEPYGLPFDDANFDFAFSAEVLEHVQDHDAAFRELARVLRPGAASVHMYPPRWAPLEPHTFIPLATVIHARSWLYLWARLGIRNQFQRGLDADETVRRNHRFLIENTSYPSRREMLRMAERHFLEARYVEADYLAGRAPRILARPYSGLHSRILLTRHREQTLHRDQCDSRA